jgi:two-component system, NtrC family, sensor kinase
MKCSRCQQDNPVPDAQFCPRCGAPVKHVDESGMPAASHADLQRELQARNRELTEALERQTATAEILGVISSSPTDAQPVFDAIAVNALRLCGADGAVVVRYDGGLLHVAAHHNVNPEAVERLQRVFPRAPDRQQPMGRAVLDGAVVHVPNLQASVEFSGSVARQFGAQSHVSIPLLHEGRAIGAIGISRRTPGPFSDRQIALLQTFADQAVIAIENVRLFNETKEALEQQTATSDILRVISSSPRDVQPVFDAIAQSATRLCEAFDVSIFRVDGDRLAFVAHHGPIAQRHGDFSLPLVRGTVGGRSVLESRTVQVADLQNEDREFPDAVANARRFGFRTILSVPLLREGIAIGGIQLRRTEVQLFSERQIALLQTFADQAVIAIENVRLFKELEERNRDLTTALDRQTATSEILRVISSSPTDVQPVFDTIVQSAVRLCHAANAGVFLTDGRTLDLPANYGSSSPEALATIRAQYPQPVDQETTAGVAILTRSVIHVPDIEAPSAAEVYTRRVGRLLGVRSMVAVPMMRKGEVLGAINLSRQEPGRFSDIEVELLKTFADQAVIAIENVRLFNELQQKNEALTQAHAQVSESLEQQTATSEILRVISSSPTDVQPVFEAIVRGASGLLGGLDCIAVRFDGTLMHLLARHNPRPGTTDVLTQLYPQPPSRTLSMGRVILDKTIVHISDVREDAAFDQRYAELIRLRGVLAVPIKRDDSIIGGISVSRSTPGHFSERQIALLQTFADQAVIAIENVRLFTELEARNRDLTEALEQQTATAEILRVISSSPTDIQPVLDAVAENAARVCGADDALIFRVDGDVTRRVAHHGSIPVSADVERRLTRDSVWGRSVVDRRTVHVPDIEAEAGEAFADSTPLARQSGARTHLATPLMRQGAVIGAILIRRLEVRLFTAKQISLLQTFADQAVIAIENVRLFTELQEKNRALTAAHAQATEALEQQTATSEILRVISSSLTDLQPVLDTIAEHAMRLCEGVVCNVCRFDGELVHLAATTNVDPDGVTAIRGAFPMPLGPQSAATRTVLTRTIVHIPDILDDREYGIAQRSLASGFRSVVAVPMLRDGSPLGSIVVGRPQPGPFSERQIELLQTFADQAVIAIENVRLFTELEEKNRALTDAHATVTESLERQTATSEILRVISSSPTDVQPVFDVIVKNACRLCDGVFANAVRFDGR